MTYLSSDLVSDEEMVEDRLFVTPPESLIEAAQMPDQTDEELTEDESSD